MKTKWLRASSYCIHTYAKSGYRRCPKLARLPKQIMQLLRVGGYVVYYGTLWAADEVLQHDAFPAMRQFNADLARDPRVVAMMVPLSYGITLCVKTVELDGGAYADAKGAGDDAVAKLLLERRAAVEQELAAME